MPDKPLKPSSGKELRRAREQGYVLPFPSGESYRIRPATAAGLLKRGKLPNVLLSFVVDALYNGTDGKKVDEFLTLSEKEENAVEFLASLQVVCEEMFMEPRIVASPQADDELTIDDIPIVDQAFAFTQAFRAAKEVLPFRAKQEADVGGVAEGQDDAPAGK